MDQAVPTSSKRSDPSNGRCHRRRRSFTEALKDKYCTEENWDTEGLSIKIVLHGKPRNKEGGAELGFLTNVVLEKCSISQAGLPADGLVPLCPNIVDLDLASNLIESWAEILPILSELRHLKFVNLARNPFKDTEVLKHWKQDLPIENLVLNNTGIAWADVIRLAQFMPRLKELHICKNGYSKLSDESLGVFRNLECLRLNENRITRWEEVWKLRSLPKLSFLILSGNPLLEVFYRKSDQSGDRELTNQNQGPSSEKTGDRNEDIENRNARTISECSVSSIENEIRDIELNFDDSDGYDTIENEEGNGEQSFDDLDDSKMSEHCNSFVEDVMLKVIGRMLDQDKNSDLDTCEGQAGVQGHDLSGPEIGVPQDNLTKNGNPEKDQDAKQTNKNCDCPNKHGRQNFRMSNVPFAELKDLCISETLLSKWSDLEALAKFPKLQRLRVKDVSLLSHVPMEERRKLFLANLPMIQSLNGSEVNVGERDKSERHFLRYFAKMKHQPERYAELINKHGKLKPVKEVDIGFGLKEWARMGIVYKGIKVYEENIHVVEPIGELRQFISRKLLLPIRSFRMLHYPCGKGHKNQKVFIHLEELRLDSLPMSRFDFMEGDEIHVDDGDAKDLGTFGL